METEYTLSTRLVAAGRGGAAAVAPEAARAVPARVPGARGHAAAGAAAAGDLGAAAAAASGPGAADTGAAAAPRRAADRVCGRGKFQQPSSVESRDKTAWERKQTQVSKQNAERTSILVSMAAFGNADRRTSQLPPSCWYLGYPKRWLYTL